MEEDEATESADSLLRAIARAPDTSPDPERIGRFRVTGRIGAGGMGVVYRAEDESLQRPVAIKVLPADVQGDSERRKRLVREARAAAAVTHPNLAAVYEVGEADGRVYLAMELVEGESLRARLNTAKLPLVEALNIATQIAKGLSRAHRAGIVHRDLKPENVMVSDDGHVKVLDFGLAKIRAAEADNESAFAKGETVTHEGRVMGTPAYMAPEQARGLDVTAAADVFAFGVMLYEMIAGRRPFAGKTMAEVAIAIDRGPAKSISDDPALNTLLGRCLAPIAADRPADGDALVSALSSLAPSARVSPLSGDDIAPTVDALTPETELPMPRRRMRPAIVASVIGTLLLICGVVGARFRTAAPMPVAASTASVAAAPIATAIADLPIPTTTVPDAAAEYVAGIQAFRDDSTRRAEAHFARAVELDPSMAAAHLRLAQMMFYNDERTAPRHEHFERALSLRSRLTERDRALAEALEPVLLRPHEDTLEETRRLAEIHDRWPGDVEILDLLIGSTAGDAKAQLAFTDNAISLDPKDGMALEARALALRNLGRNAESRVAYERAAAVAVTSVDALEALTNLDSTEGRCADLERHAQMVAARNLAPTVSLYEAYVANDRPDELVRQVIEQSVAAEPKGQQTMKRLGRLANYAVLHGDFTTARARRVEQASAVAADAELSQSLSAHYWGTNGLIAIATEIGDTAEAVRLARDHLAHAEGWAGSRFDRTYIFFMRRLVAGSDPVARAAYAKERDASAEDWLASKLDVPLNIWLLHYGVPLDDATDAAEALAALDRFGPIPAEPFWDGDGAFGMMYFYLGRMDDAIPYLRRWLASCRRVWYGDSFPGVAVALGNALESKGDIAGACEAYAKVAHWWPQPKPKSVTADKARAARAALHCQDSPR